MVEVSSIGGARSMQEAELRRHDIASDHASPANAIGALIVGAGFGGLCMAIRLRKAGHESFLVIEKEDDVGGTWRDNRYPGCACDVPSHLYSLSFAQKNDWSRLYPTQPELLAYLRSLVGRFQLQRHIRFNVAMKSADWDEANRVWRVTTDTGEVICARFLLSAVGELHLPAHLSLPGLADFQGATFHSSKWRDDYDVRGKRIAVIGTGASAIQIVPQLAPNVERLLVFQRSAPWVLPKRDRPIGGREQLAFGRLPGYGRMFRQWLYWRHEIRVLGLRGYEPVLRIYEGIVRRHIARFIDDDRLRRILTPNYRMGCKRVLISDDYYPALARPNVEVVAEPIAELQADRIVTSDGVERSVDAIIFATGFNVAGTLASKAIVGRDGRKLGDLWRDGIRSYYGICVAGFPNYFMLFGPNTGLAHNSIVIMIEAQANYIIDCLEKLDRMHSSVIDVRPEVQERFDQQLQARMSKTVWQTGGCHSWYQDSAGRNVAMWPGYTFEYGWRVRRANLSGVTPSVA
jgi:cation diffusion facilitator CzcD-associated flavoprotein CzcO